MSQLSEFWKKKRYLFEEAISFAETEASGFTGEQKAAFVIGILKAAHIAVGGVWGALIEQAVLSAIDYELAQLRERSAPKQPAQPPAVTSIYDVWETGVLPSDEELLKRGFKSGDTKWKSVDGTQWEVGHPGGIEGGGAVLAGTIGG